MKPAYGRDGAFGIERSDGVRLDFSGDAGAALRMAREAMGLDLGAVAKATCIRSDYLAALEEGDCRQMPPKAYAVAYARTYAEYVGLDAAAIANAMKAEYLFAEARQIKLVKAPRRDRRLPRGLTGAVALIAVTLAAMTWYGVNMPARDVDTRPAPTPEALLEWSYQAAPDRSVWNAMAVEAGAASPVWRAGAPLRAETLRPEHPGVINR